MRQYPIIDEPTDAEFRAFFKVEHYFEQMQVAEWLSGREDLTPDEFDLLVHRFHKCDFGAEENECIGYEYDRIIEERS